MRFKIISHRNPGMFHLEEREVRQQCGMTRLVRYGFRE